MAARIIAKIIRNLLLLTMLEGAFQYLMPNIIVSGAVTRVKGQNIIGRIAIDSTTFS